LTLVHDARRIYPPPRASMLLMFQLRNGKGESNMVKNRAAASRYMNWRAVFYALASAALFGISTPAAKVLLGSMHPAVLAGLLYCGAGIGVALLRWLRLHSLSTSDVPESALTRSQLSWLAGAIAG
jgi:hypothetical protein